jgi:hypothetical protein
MAIAQRSESPAQAPSRSTQQKPNEVRLIPYVELNGARTLPDTFLEDVFDEMVVEGLVSAVFAGTNISSSKDFIGMMRHPTNIPVFVVAGTRCIGFAWLNGIALNHAYGHFCTFPNGVMTAIEMGEMVMGYWWSLGGPDSYALEVILGTIPAFNSRAVRFIQKLGFVKVGEIPKVFLNPMTNERWPAVVLYCTRP